VRGMFGGDSMNFFLRSHSNAGILICYLPSWQKS
jgi:hypothetical protein